MSTLELLPPTSEASKTETKKPNPRIHNITDNEWVALIVNLYRKVYPNLRHAICLGKYTDPDTLHKAYTNAVELNPLYLRQTEAMAADKATRLWLANIQAIGTDVRGWKDLLAKCIVSHRASAGHLVVITDQPEQASGLFADQTTLIVSPRPMSGRNGQGTFKLRCKNRDYLYFLNVPGRCTLEYDTGLLSLNHHIFSSADHLEKIFVNFAQSDLCRELENRFGQLERADLIPLQYIDTEFRVEEQLRVSVPRNGVPQLSALAQFFLKTVPELTMYNPVEMRETSLFNALRNPLFAAATGYDDAVKVHQSLGFQFDDTPESRRRVDKHVALYRERTVPMIKPTGDQLLAYYRPAYYTARRHCHFIINGQRVPAFHKGKKYYLYPVQRSEVIELPPTTLMEADGETSRKMTLHCTYTALSLTSELTAKDLNQYVEQNGASNYKVITAEEYQLAQQLQSAVAMGNDQHAEELRKRLASMRGRTLQITSKDAHLSEVLDVFPPPEVKTLSEAYPEKLKARIQRLMATKAQLTDVQTLHAGLASLKRGVVFTHNVGSGKTRIAAYAAIAAGARRVAFIAKSKIIGEIIKELRDELQLDVVHLHSITQIRALAQEVKRGPKPQRTQFYVLSQEFLTIGGLANQAFDPYAVDIIEQVPDQQPETRCHTLVCSRENAENQIKDQILTLRAEGVITGDVRRIPFHFHQHVQECPRCMERAARAYFSINPRKRWLELSPATRETIRDYVVDYVKRGKAQAGLREFGTFSPHGHCRVCGYIARSYRRIHQAQEQVAAEVAELLDALGEEEKRRPVDFSSCLQFPAYRLLKNLFDTKICDEAHTLTGQSKVYEAVKSIRTRRTYLLSGTLLRRSPAEMWQVFTLLWGYKSPEFPFAYDQQNEFVNQHVTYRHIRDSIFNPGTQKTTRKHQKQEMPEPANAPKLWKFLHEAQLHATNRSMGLHIPATHRHFVAIELEGDILSEYDQKRSEMRTAYLDKPSVFSTKVRKDWFSLMNELQAIALQAKLGQILPLVQELAASRRNVIVACRLQKTFGILKQTFRGNGLDFVVLDEKKPAQPHKRREWLDHHYVNAPVPILLTRTPLINESLNNLVKASAIVVVEAEYVFYPLQQLEGRIARPKQKADAVDIIYLVTRHPNSASIDEAMLQMALRRNNANVELISGNVTQRSNEQLIELAESQKMRELELMETILKEAQQAAPMDYSAEFQAREHEIEQAERQRAIIVLSEQLRSELDAVPERKLERVNGARKSESNSTLLVPAAQVVAAPARIRM